MSTGNRIIMAKLVIEPVVIEAEPEPEIDTNDTTLLKKYIEDLEKKILNITKLKNNAEEGLKNSKKGFKDAKKTYNIEYKKQTNINNDITNKYKLKITELNAIIQNRETEYIKTIDEMHAKQISHKMIIDNTLSKLNQVKNELPLNFDKAEYNNKYFVEFLIELTLTELTKIK